MIICSAASPYALHSQNSFSRRLGGQIHLEEGNKDNIHPLSLDPGVRFLYMYVAGDCGLSVEQASE